MAGLWRDYVRVADHKQIAAAARSNPNEWQFVGRYPGADNVRAIDSAIHRATVLTSYAPAGAFQTWRSLGDDRLGLWVRYVHGVKPSPEVPEDLPDAVRLIAAVAIQGARYMSAGQAAALLEGHGYADAAEQVRAFIAASSKAGRTSAMSAASYLFQQHTVTGATK